MRLDFCPIDHLSDRRTLYMLGRYTNMIEGDDSHAADTMHNCFDEAARARAQDPHRPVRMTGGLVKSATLQKLSVEEGEFMSPSLAQGDVLTNREIITILTASARGDG